MFTFLAVNALITAADVALYTYKRKKVKEKTVKMLESNGYSVDSKKINQIFNFCLGDNDKQALRYYIDSFNEKVGQFAPMLNVYYCFQNIKYLSGDHSKQKYYDNYSDFKYYNKKTEGNDKSPIDYMKEWNIVRESNVINISSAKETIEDKKTHDILSTNIPTHQMVKRNTQKLVLEMKNESK